MEAQDFCYWLQGYLEMSGDAGKTFNEQQVEMLKKHLALVMTNVTGNCILPDAKKQEVIKPSLSRIDSFSGGRKIC